MKKQAAGKNYILKFQVHQTLNVCVIYVYMGPGKGKRIHLIMLEMVTAGVVMALEPEEWDRKTYYTLSFCTGIFTMYLCYYVINKLKAKRTPDCLMDNP